MKVAVVIATLCLAGSTANAQLPGGQLPPLSQSYGRSYAYGPASQADAWAVHIRGLQSSVAAANAFQLGDAGSAFSSSMTGGPQGIGGSFSASITMLGVSHSVSRSLGGPGVGVSSGALSGNSRVLSGARSGSGFLQPPFSQHPATGAGGFPFQ